MPLEPAVPNKRSPRFSSICRVVLLAGLLASCKLTVIVPEGGRVVDADGFVCNSGETCEIEISDATFDAVFTAEPAPGFDFARWRLADRRLCGNKSTPCAVSNTLAAGDQTLLGLIAGDLELFLEPVFVSFDLSYWQQVLQEVDSGDFERTNYLYATPPIVGQCDPGLLKAAPKNRALEATNRVRALHNLPAVDYDSSYDMQAQETSLVERANNYLNHFPDPADACYSQAAADGAASANLSGGTPPLETDPAADIFGWTNDNLNAGSVMQAGHRRWIIDPDLGYVSYGQVEGYGTLKIFNFGMAPDYEIPPELAFVAFPYRAYPFNLVSQGQAPTPWSISIVPQSGEPSSFDYFAASQVTVREQDSGKQLSVSNLYRDNEGFGLANFLSWMVADWEYDTYYEVTISDVQRPGGAAQDLQYWVMVDRYDLFNIDHPRERTDGRAGNVLEGRFNSAEDRDSYTVPLAGATRFTGRSEFSNQAFFILVYDRQKNLLASSDQAFSQSFKKGKYTVVVSPCDENGLCYQSTSTYRVSYD